MGLFHFSEAPPVKGARKHVSTETLHKAECKACPLNGQAHLRHPHMEATGAKRPTVYILGEAPGKNEDLAGKQFVGTAGKILRRRIDRSWDNELRWNNCVRCRPPDNKTPEYVEIECCRPSVARDIEATKPEAIFAFGNVPLHWALNTSGISKWRGRMVPIKVGKHACWLVPMFHPSYVNREKDKKEGRDIEFVFNLDLERAFAAVEAGLPEPIIHTPEDAARGVQIATGRERGDLKRVLEFLEECECSDAAVGLDFETKRMRPYYNDAKILSIGLSRGADSLAFALEHKDSGWSERQRDEIEAAFKSFLLHSTAKKIVHQLAYEMEWTAYYYGTELLRARPWEDTVSQAFILDERMKMGKPDAHSLAFLTLQYFGFNIKTLDNLNKDKLDDEPLESVLRYNAIDAKYHRALHFKQIARLKDEGLLQVYREHLERVPTMVLTQLQGVPVSQRVVQTFYNKHSDALEKLEAKIAADPMAKKFKQKFGTEYRPSNNGDVKKMCHSIFKCFTESADEAELKKVNKAVTNLTLKWRKIKKVLSTYVLPVKEGSPHLFSDGKIHPIISTTLARTQRTSSEDPNIQNWPKRREEQKEVRRQIKPRKGPLGPRKIVSFDYGQIQARNVAMESKDKVLVKAFWDEYDIHADWMERTAELHPKWCDKGVKQLVHDKGYRKSKRNEAKNGMVFPWFFGAHPPKIGKSLGIPVEIAQILFDEISAKFPDVSNWHKRVIDFYHDNGYVTGLTGFRRRAPISPNQLINSPIQSDEAAIVCDAMTRLSKMGLQAAMEIHDDLTFIMYQSEIEKNAEIIIGEMLACPFKWAHIVPLVVEMAVGDDWYSLKDVGAYSSDKWNGTLRSDKADLSMIGTWADGTGWADKGYSKGEAFSRPRRRGER